MNEWQIVCIFAAVSNLVTILACELMSRSRDQWEKNSNEWRKMATAAISECLYWRRLEASRNPAVYVETSLPNSITATQISDKVH